MNIIWLKFSDLRKLELKERTMELKKITEMTMNAAVQFSFEKCYAGYARSWI